MKHFICRAFGKYTVKAPTNIALIKYWGKSNEDINLPLNSSISLTVDIEQFFTQTTIELNDEKNQLILNNEPAEITGRISRVINMLKSLTKPENLEKKIKIESCNNFPTAAGMASSASGLAALTFGLAKAYKVNISMEELSGIARLGSGSASRSFFGGIVEWSAGDSHEKSIARQLYENSHWDELRLLVILTDLEKKKISSTNAMKLNRKMLLERANERVPIRIENLKKALEAKDFENLAKITMEESDDLHYVIEAANVKYLNAKSEEIKKLIHGFNSQGIRAAYTFDAGPNPFILTRKQDINDLVSHLLISLKLRSHNDLKLHGQLPNDPFLFLQSSATIPVFGIIESKISRTGPILL
ncbi:unnamed protein product [Blepharisma stoltei]|uniref:Diphosphomevalonate decarboxylase n=1 Tax=Blepharisma stoltei TaxID=1481888 RepID=A0AAU9KS18_9CILI|nr:unnamed protein product [Blepharisma stoltei]